MRRYIINVLVALDQLGAALCGMDPDECISSFAGKMKRKGNPWLANIIDFFFGKGHCESNIEDDEGQQGIIKPE